MQQPPNNPPGGPYGNAPYGNTPYAPPPRRGPSPLLFCLGCLGLAGVAFVIFSLFIGFKVKSAMKPIPQAEVRTVLPADVPLYPKFTYNEQASRRMPIPGMAGMSMTILSFNCPDGIETVGPWYQAQLTPRGWTGGVSTSNARQYHFQKGNEMVMVQSTPVGNMIQVMVARGFPAGRHPGTSFPSSGQQTW